MTIQMPAPEILDGDLVGGYVNKCTLDSPNILQTDHKFKNKIYFGDCLDIIRKFPDESVDLIVTSPPYADARSHTYGGIKPDDYVKWFSKRAVEMHRVLKPTGSFVLNIKEKAVDGERHTYVLELILALKREVGFRWVEEYIWHKTTSAPGRWKYRFRDAWERILHFSKTKDVKMNQESVKISIGDWTDKRLKQLSKNDH
ncbi:MAG: site-specific DNA-methyltransferase [Paracoccaceae bacterium]|nr:site-specific DNA-methyltransferase [Paracoccaceae bacterium]MDE2917398.1 site-specific DNA-methyltransferase [Paracoccaceae bacterium]